MPLKCRTCGQRVPTPRHEGCAARGYVLTGSGYDLHVRRCPCRQWQTDARAKLAFMQDLENRHPYALGMAQALILGR